MRKIIMNARITLLALATISLGLVPATFAKPRGLAGSAAKADIVDTALNNGHFNTLVAALQTAGLSDTLKGSGPFTVFAPTDEAFQKLAPGTLETLLKPENKQQLINLLSYHVVAGTVTAKELRGKTATPMTVEGDALAIDATQKKIMVDNAEVTRQDVAATNGVIQVIDTVLIPKSLTAAQPMPEPAAGPPTPPNSAPMANDPAAIPEQQPK
jgi:uncharacterized surface protein with fasciclin (FAS1) repeats